MVVCVACGCGKPSTTTKEMDAPRFTVDQGGDKVEIKRRGADGSVPKSSGGGVKVPEDFPKDIPVYPGATAIVHQSVKNGRYLQLKMSDAADKVTTFYQEKLKAEGWKQVSESRSESPRSGSTLLMNSKDKRTLSVVVSHDDKETTLTLSVSIKD
jgi:hypothetical protein